MIRVKPGQKANPARRLGHRMEHESRLVAWSWARA
jgi:hypothetical protein